MKIFNNAPPTPHAIDQNKSIDKAGEKGRIGHKESTTRSPGADNVEISEEARFRSLAREVAGQSPDIRRDKVDSLKRAIQSGTYQVDAAKVADKLVDAHVETDFGKNNL